MLTSKTILFISCIFLATHSMAQEASATKQKVTQYTLSVRPVAGFVFAHDDQVSNTANTHIAAVEIMLNRKRTDANARRYSRRYFNSGFSLAYFHFSKSFLGNGIVGSFFIEPYFINNNNFTFGPVAKIGLSYNSNPYHEELNNANFSYSSYINPYLSVGLNSTVRLTDRFHLDGAIHFNHISNGGIKHPNYGMNFPTVSVGFEAGLAVSKKEMPTKPPDFKWRFDMVPFTSYKSIPRDKKHFYWVYGFALQANLKPGQLHAFNLGAEWLSDLGKKKEFEMTNMPQLDHNRLGILAGHEFIFRKFNFSQQLGVFIYNEDPNMGLFYHRWGLYYKLDPHLMIGGNLSAHKLTADFVDLRLVFSLYQRNQSPARR